MKNIMILGSEGYVGSALSQYLKNKYNTIGVDLCWFGKYQKDVINKDFSQLDEKYFDVIDAVILLAGHSSTKMCVGNWTSAFFNNVSNFVFLLEKIRQNKTKLIFASSSSVYGNTFGEIADEDRPQKNSLNEYDASKIMLEHAALQEKEIEWYGLRFGTVNGFSPNFRSELMINSMYTNAKSTSKINVTNSSINRSILGISDLCLAIDAILQKGSVNLSGFYNVSSFNSTVDEISNVISEMTNSEIIYNEDLPNPYDFRTSNVKFETSFDFKFTDTISSIVEDIERKYNCIQKIGDRNTALHYRS